MRLRIIQVKAISGGDIDIDFRFIAEGAVRFPESVRFTPKAAQSRFERTWMGSFSLPNEREELLSFKTCIKGLPLSTCGFKSWIGLSSSEKLKVAQINEIENTGAVDRNDILFNRDPSIVS